MGTVGGQYPLYLTVGSLYMVQLIGLSRVMEKIADRFFAG